MDMGRIWPKELADRVNDYFIKHCATLESLHELIGLIDWVREEKEIELGEK